MEQPWALTIRVSQTSEKGAPGSRLVTAIGSVTGTLELRRTVSGTLGMVISPRESAPPGPADRLDL
jgi:hypothetical protein